MESVESLASSFRNLQASVKKSLEKTVKEKKEFLAELTEGLEKVTDKASSLSLSSADGMVLLLDRFGNLSERENLTARKFREAYDELCNELLRMELFPSSSETVKPPVESVSLDLVLNSRKKQAAFFFEVPLVIHGKPSKPVVSKMGDFWEFDFVRPDLTVIRKVKCCFLRKDSLPQNISINDFMVALLKTVNGTLRHPVSPLLDLTLDLGRAHLVPIVPQLVARYAASVFSNYEYEFCVA